MLGIKCRLLRSPDVMPIPVIAERELFSLRFKRCIMPAGIYGCRKAGTVADGAGRENWTGVQKEVQRASLINAI